MLSKMTSSEASFVFARQLAVSEYFKWAFKAATEVTDAFTDKFGVDFSDIHDHGSLFTELYAAQKFISQDETFDVLEKLDVCQQAQSAEITLTDEDLDHLVEIVKLDTLEAAIHWLRTRARQIEIGTKIFLEIKSLDQDLRCYRLLTNLPRKLVEYAAMVHLVRNQVLRDSIGYTKPNPNQIQEVVNQWKTETSS